MYDIQVLLSDKQHREYDILHCVDNIFLQKCDINLCLGMWHLDLFDALVKIVMNIVEVNCMI